MAVVVLAACGGGGAGEEERAIPSTTTVTTEVTTTTSVGPGEGGGSAGGAADGGSTTVSAGGSSSTVPTGPMPTIISFTTPGDIDCATGDLQEFTAGWATADAVEVTIAIDGIVYDTHPATGTARLPFSCAGSHTFVLTAIGDGGRTALRSVTLRPLNASNGSGKRDT